MARHQKYSEQDMRALYKARQGFRGTLVEFAEAVQIPLSSLSRYLRFVKDQEQGLVGRYNSVKPRRGPGRPKAFKLPAAATAPLAEPQAVAAAPVAPVPVPVPVAQNIEAHDLERLQRENAALKRVLAEQWGFRKVG